MKKFVTAICIILASFMTANAQIGDPAYDAELDKAISYSLSEQQFAEVYQQAFKQLVDNGTLTQAKCDAMSAELAKALYPDLVKIVKSLWANNFNLDELKQITAWLASPIGQKLTALTAASTEATQNALKQPAVIQKINTIVTRYIQAK